MIWLPYISQYTTMNTEYRTELEYLRQQVTAWQTRYYDLIRVYSNNIALLPTQINITLTQQQYEQTILPQIVKSDQSPDRSSR